MTAGAEGGWLPAGVDGLPAGGGCPPERCAACAVRDGAICASLDDHQLAALHAIGRRRMLPAGQALCWAGQPSTSCATLVSGALKVVREEPDGRTQIVGLLFPGDFVGELFADRASETVVALADSDLCLYPRAALEPLLARYPLAARLLMRRALATLGEARRWMLMLGRCHAPEKVAAFLLDMERRLGATGGDYELPMARGAIGEVLGLTIETVSRQMTALKRAGLIALPGGRRVRLLDRQGLALIAG